MKVVVNGKEETLENSLTIGSFLKGKKMDINSVVVEHNKAIIVKEEYDLVTLKDKDTLEILRFVGGG